MLKQEVRQMGFSRCVAIDRLVLHSLFVAARIAVGSGNDDPDRTVFLFEVLVREALEQRRLEAAAQHVEAFGSFLAAVANRVAAASLRKVQDAAARIAVKVWNAAVESGVDGGGELVTRLKQLCRAILPHSGEHRPLLEGHLYVFS
jgi:hypothetical protein